MAFERLSDNKIKGDGLDVFVDNRLKMFSRQVSIRNAEDELHFNTAVLEQNLSLEDQLNYRKEQLKRVADSPDERRRIRAEIASLNDRVEQKKYSDEYTSKLIDFESGVSSIDSMIGWLNDRLSNTTDQNIKDSINKNLLDMTSQRFELQKQVLQRQTDYALKDKTDAVIGGQINKVTSLKNQALLSGNDDLISIYDLQIQALNQAKTEAAVERTIKDFSASTMLGGTATSLLDSFNGKISGASSTGGKITIGGVTYDSEQEFWRTKRDSYVADDSANGFFSRVKDEAETKLKTAYSSNILTNDLVVSTANNLNTLAARPELQPYSQKINDTRQDILQTGTDFRANTILAQYSVDSDVNKAVANLNYLKGIGANVDSTMSKIINEAADIKTKQLTGIYQSAGELIQKGVAPDKAIEQAVKEGAGSYLSPDQLATKSAETLAKETQVASTTGAFTTPDSRTTVSNPTAPTGATPPPVVPTNQNSDLSAKYGKVGNAIYRKSDGKAFSNSSEFFADAGVTSFSGLKFDTAYQPPTVGASPQLQNKVPAAPAPTPAAPQPAQPVSYKVVSGDTLSAIAQKYLGDAKRYNEIAKANNITDPNKIAVGQQLVIPKK